MAEGGPARRRRPRPGCRDDQAILAFVFAGASGDSGVAPGQRERIYVMFVGGTRLMIMTYYHPTGTVAAEDAAAAELQAIVDSIEFR